jgi:DNA-binding MarR family transcriptional regulator
VSEAVDLLAEAPTYSLDDQVGFILRQVNQRHALIFAGAFGDDLTPMQWAALAKLAERGECSQNLLGRLVSMDVATVKGVVDRLQKRGLADTSADPEDRRRVVVRLTAAGRDLYRTSVGRAARVTDDTLGPLDPKDRDTLIRLLRRIS